MGCTHFPLLYDLFVAKAGHRITVLESASLVAQSIPPVNEMGQSGIRKIYTTDDPDLFEKLGAPFLAVSSRHKK